MRAGGTPESDGFEKREAIVDQVIDEGVESMVRCVTCEDVDERLCCSAALPRLGSALKATLVVPDTRWRAFGTLIVAYRRFITRVLTVHPSLPVVFEPIVS